MKKPPFVLLVILLIVSVACDQISGSGNVITQERPVSGFNKIAMSGSGELIITQGSKEGLTVEAEDNIMEYIETEVKDETLELGMKNVRWIKKIRFQSMGT